MHGNVRRHPDPAALPPSGVADPCDKPTPPVMNLTLRMFARVAFLCACILSPLCLEAKNSTWSDGQGGTFKGEPDEAIGPFAVFKTSNAHGRRLLFRQLSLAECKRFAEESYTKIPYAETWAQSKGFLTSSLVKRLNVVENGKLVPLDYGKRPEPHVVVFYYGSGWGGQSWETVFKVRQAYSRLKRLYGDFFEFVFLGVRHNAEAQVNIATTTVMPWPVATYSEQNLVPDFAKFAPEEGERMIALTRNGIPLLDSKIASTQELAKFIDQLSGILSASEPSNSLFWSDQARFLSASRPVLQAGGAVPPLVVNRPFIDAALRKGGIVRIKASLAVSAEGKVLSAALEPEAQVPERFRDQVCKTLVAYCAVLPALKDGVPVEGTVVFDHSVPPLNEKLELDRRWIASIGQNEISLNSWLLLRPIPVPEMEFSKVVGTDDKGVTQMSALRVGGDEVSKKSQLNAFNSDFFAEGGPASVAPKSGELQSIDGESYFWEPITSSDGLVDFANKKRVEFSVGYAYTEFDCDKAGTALMGLGSDDGVKIWLNGVLVKDAWVRRNTRIDEDIFPLPLQAGKNRLLIKIQNMKGEWSFFARIRR